MSASSPAARLGALVLESPFWRSMRKATRPTMRPRATRPPITPPTIAPTLGLATAAAADGDDEGVAAAEYVGEGEGAAATSAVSAPNVVSSYCAA